MISKKEFIKKVEPKLPFYRKYVKRCFEGVSYLKSFKVDASTSECKKFVLLTICNKKSFRMVKVMLCSFLKKSQWLPEKVVIVSDGSWTEAEAKKYFSSVNYTIEFDNWELCAIFCSKLGYEDLNMWAKKQIWGKKMAAIVKYSINHLVLFSDPDILWYGCPVSESDLNATEMLKLSIDNSHNYDEKLIAKMELDYLNDSEPINCGVVLVKGDILAKSLQVQEAIRYEASEPGNFAEQTIFALMNSENGSTWSEDEITASIDDVVSSIFKQNKYPKQMVARHYLWALKWLYWKDFIFKI